MAPNTLPAMAKATANYANSRAHQDGSARRRLRRGHRARRRRATSAKAAARTCSSCATASSTRRRCGSSILGGITRDSVITLARDLGYDGARGSRSRARRSTSPTKCSSCGTAAEVTPIRSVDKIAIGSGQPRPGHRGASSGAFFDVINGEVPDTHGWLTLRLPGRSDSAAGRRSRRGHGSDAGAAPRAPGCSLPDESAP